MKKIYVLLIFIIQIQFILTTNVVNASDLLKQMYGGEFFEQDPPDWTVTTIDNPSPGYLRFEWPSTNDFYLVDNYGTKQFYNINSISKLHFKLLSNGLWISPSDTKHYLFDQNLNLVDSIPNPTSYDLDYHEVELLSNGHYLLLCVEQITMDLSGIVAGGSKAAIVLSSVLVETDRNGHIYWEWHAIDHTNITDVTSDIDLTQMVIDFTHINSFVEDNNGNIIVSIRHFDEISKINKTTGNFIWRMGGSACKNNEFSFVNDLNNDFVGFSHQHSITLLPNGNILLYDNGNLKKQLFSRAVEYQINESTKSVTKVWEYRNNPDIYCPAMGSVYRLTNGNTLINWGTKAISELKPDNTKAFEITYNSTYPSSIYRAYKYITKMNAVTLIINGANNYSFTDGLNNTFVNLYVSSLSGTGNVSVEKHDYAPPKASFADSNFTSIFPFRWVLTESSIKSINGLIKIKANSNLNIPDPNKVALYQRSKEASGTFQEISTSYNSVTNDITANLADFGEFIIVSKVLGKPLLLTPFNNSEKVPLSGRLTWKSLIGANIYQVQVSDNENFTNPKINKIIENQNEYNYKNLQSDTKFYWRIRGINSKDTSNWSEPFIFTTDVFLTVELLAPKNNSYGFKLTDTLFWQDIQGAENYWLQVSKDSKFSSLITEKTSIDLPNEQLYNLDYDTPYFWRVKAFHIMDTSNWSEIWNFRTEMSKPELITPSADTINVSSELYFSWNQIAGADYYNLEISESNLFNSITLDSNKIFNNFIVLKNFQTDKHYFWRVKAIRSTDSSAWSEINGFYTLLQKPSLVYPLNLQTKLSVNTKFEWAKTESAASYLLQVSLFSDFMTLIIDSNIVLSEQFLPQELPPNKEIFWRIRAEKGTMHSNWSDTWSFITDKGLQLATPKLNSPKNNSKSNVSGDFIWTKIDKAITYSIQVSLTNDFKTNLINKYNQSNNIFHFTDFLFETTYYWRVKAHSLFDSSQFSETWMMKTIPKKNIITLLNPGNDQLQVPVSGRLTWDSISNKDFYILELSSDSLFKTIVTDSNKIINAYYDYSGLNLNSTYYWRVRFLKADDYSPWSSIWSFTTVAPETLPIPDLKTPIDNKIGALINGALTWVAVPNAETYQISLSKNRNFSSIFLKNSEIIETLFLYSNLEYNQTYFWRVSAVAENAKSSWSVQRSFLTELESPVILYPENNSIDIAVDDGLLWTVNDDVALYHVQIAKDSLFSNTIEDVNNLYEMNHDFNLDENTVYYSRVKSYNDSNQSRWSKFVAFKTGIRTSVGNGNKNDKISVYPNPATDRIQFNDDRLAGIKYLIYSLEGQLISNGTIYYNSIDVNNLSSGFYYLKIGNEMIGFIKL